MEASKNAGRPPGSPEPPVPPSPVASKVSPSNYTKPFSIAGAALAEIYMLYTVLAPNSSGVTPPISAILSRIAACGIFFGIFGALIGLGIGLIATGIAQKLKR